MKIKINSCEDLGQGIWKVNFDYIRTRGFFNIKSEVIENEILYCDFDNKNCFTLDGLYRKNIAIDYYDNGWADYLYDKIFDAIRIKLKETQFKDHIEKAEIKFSGKT